MQGWGDVLHPLQHHGMIGFHPRQGAMKKGLTKWLTP
jgi:hypothetical protein